MYPTKLLELISNGLPQKYERLVDLKKHPTAPYLLLNYTETCTYQRVWDEITIPARGLILRNDGSEVIALPFPKFFNFGELAADKTAELVAQPFRAFEKVDGAMGVSYRDEHGDLNVATRGSFTSPQSEFATMLLQRTPAQSLLPEELTLVMEVIDPRFQVVVDYGDTQELVVLGIRNRRDGAELPWEETQDWANKLGLRTANTFEFASWNALIASRSRISSDLEGYVVRFTDGTRAKVKGDVYLRLHKARSSISDKSVRSALIDGSWNTYIVSVPEEFRAQVESMAAKMTRKANLLRDVVVEIYANAPENCSQKEFAEWVIRTAPKHKGALFKLRAGRTPPWLEMTK